MAIYFNNLKGSLRCAVASILCRITFTLGFPCCCRIPVFQYFQYFLKFRSIPVFQYSQYFQSILCWITFIRVSLVVAEFQYSRISSIFRSLEVFPVLPVFPVFPVNIMSDNIQFGFPLLLQTCTKPIK